MHLLKIEKGAYPGQADPFILKSGGRYYIYGYWSRIHERRYSCSTKMHVWTIVLYLLERWINAIVFMGWNFSSKS